MKIYKVKASKRFDFPFSSYLSLLFFFNRVESLSQFDGTKPVSDTTFLQKGQTSSDQDFYKIEKKKQQKKLAKSLAKQSRIFVYYRAMGCSVAAATYRAEIRINKK